MIRVSALAGSWYPADAAELREQIKRDLAVAPPAEGPVQALILPHAGHRYCGKVMAAGVKAASAVEFSRIILMGVSHRGGLSCPALSSASAFETPLGRMAVDTEATSKLAAAGFKIDDAAHAREHSIEIILPYLQEGLGRVGATHASPLLPVMIGHADLDDLRRWADALRPFVDDRTLIVASSDFTHYGEDFDYRPNVGDDLSEGLRRLDMGAAEFICKNNLMSLVDYADQTGITVCGLRPIMLLMQLLPPSARGELLAYTQSLEITGGDGHSVSYAAIVFREQPVRLI